MMLDVAVKSLKELGHPTRLRIFRRLVRAGLEGLPVGTLQSEMAMPGSTLSHHLAGLVTAGLVVQHRAGRQLRCVAEYHQLLDLIGYLQDECCADSWPQAAGSA